MESSYSESLKILSEESGLPFEVEGRGVSSVSDAVAFVQAVDALALSSVPGSSIRSIALLSLHLSFLATLTDAERAAYCDEAEDPAVSAARSEEIKLAKCCFPAEGYHSDPQSQALCLWKALLNPEEQREPTNLEYDRIGRVVALAQRTDRLLSLGGDDRLTLVEHPSPFPAGHPVNNSEEKAGNRAVKLNKYYAAAIPRRGLVQRGSCTCSSITAAQFRRADKLRQTMLLRTLLVAAAAELHGGPESQIFCEEDLDIELWETEYSSIRKSLADLFCLPQIPDSKAPPKVAARVTGPNGQATIHSDVGSAAAEASDRSLLSSPPIIICPSGSDAEYIPLVIAKVRAASIRAATAESELQAAAKVISLIVAAGEVGSGTASAAAGNHFSSVTPRGNAVKPNTALRRAGSNHPNRDAASGDGLEVSVDIELLVPRASDGRLVDTDAAVEARVTRILFGEALHGSTATRSALDTPTVVVLHLVCCSKTGLIIPSLNTVARLKQQFTNRLVVAVDACQLRCRLEMVRTYVDAGCIVLTTGSKFFGGGAFCGAIVLPDSEKDILEQFLGRFPRETVQEVLPAGLRDFLTAHDVPPSMPFLRSFICPTLGSAPAPCHDGKLSEMRWTNPGLVLRWATALHHMESYAKLPQGIIGALSNAWVRHVTREISKTGTENSAFCRLHVYGDNIHPELPGGVHGVVSVQMFVPGDIETGSGGLRGQDSGTRPVTLDEAKLIHRLMCEDLSYWATWTVDHRPIDVAMEGHSAADIAAFLGMRAMIGQPVKLGDGSPTPSQSHQTSKGALSLYPVVLRLALGASTVITLAQGATERFRGCSDLKDLVASSAAVANIVAEDCAIIRKLGWIGRNWHHILNPAGRQPSSQPMGPQVTTTMRGTVDAQMAQRHLEIDRAFAGDAASAATSWHSIATTTTQSAKPSPGVLSMPAAHCILSSICTARGGGTKEETKPPNCFILYDLDALDRAFDDVVLAFSRPPAVQSTLGSSTLHCLAIKSCPVTYILSCAIRKGLGLEAASLGEVVLALQVGCPPDKVVFDSPCKTKDEIIYALRHGVRINANSLQELTKIREALLFLAQESHEGGHSTSSLPNSRIGLRVNPLVGAGSIQALSTACVGSKFGVPLWPLDGEIASLQPAAGLGSHAHSDGLRRRLEKRQALAEVFAAAPFLSSIHCHVGSQGMPLSLLAEGARRTVAFCDEIEAAILRKERGEENRETTPPRRRILSVDIGGGLGVNYESPTVSPTFTDYVRALNDSCPSLLGDVSNPKEVVTEFGKSLVCKAAVLVARIEDVWPIDDLTLPVAEGASTASIAATESDPLPRVMSIAHAGADLLLRTAYCPDKFKHRVSLATSAGQPIEIATGTVTAPSETQRLPCRLTIAGPLCFSGDLVISDAVLPTPREGDNCIIHDAGANTLSLHSKHCSRQAPAVIGFRRRTAVHHAGHRAGNASPEQQDHEQEQEQASIVAVCLKPEEALEDMLRFWG